MAVKKPRARAPKAQIPDMAGYESWSPQKFHYVRTKMRDYIYENFKLSDLQPGVWKWMKNEGYSAGDIKAAKAATGTDSVRTVAAICVRMLDMGVPDYYEKHAEYWEGLDGTNGVMKPLTDYIKAEIDRAIENGKDAVDEEQAEEQKKGYTPTIQDRIRDQSQEACHAIDAWLEGYRENKKDFNFAGHFAEKSITQAHARKIREFYYGEYEEYLELANSMPTPQQIAKITDEAEKDLTQQFRDAYSHLSKTDIKKYLEGLEKILGACDVVIDKAKTTRKPRVKKAPSKDKLVAKVKYKKQDDTYQLVSLNPVDMLEANEVWVFNVKTRKLGKYIADSMTGPISVKGTSLVGFDEHKSVQKTLRKPADTLKEFKKAGKVALRKFLEDIGTTDTKLNGRLNTDTIILRVN